MWENKKFYPRKAAEHGEVLGEASLGVAMITLTGMKQKRGMDTIRHAIKLMNSWDIIDDYIDITFARMDKEIELY